MFFFKVFIVAAILLKGTLCIQEADLDDLKEHLLSVAFSQNRSHLSPEHKQLTADYIHNFWNEFTGDKVELESQSFQYPLDATSGKTYPGMNYILIVKGTLWGTSTDRPAVLGSHYDSVHNSAGVDDNGSGMAAMLETSRVFIKSNNCWQNTVIYVAFDIEEYGLIGSGVFVNEWLVPELLEKYNIPPDNFQGAVILDTIMNYNDTVNSQTLPAGFDQVFPELVAVLEPIEFRGIFLAAISRKNEEEFVSQLNRTWFGDSKPETERFLLAPIITPISGIPTRKDLFIYNDLMRSDHYQFWSYTGNYTDNGLKAIFLTDTANFRGSMATCYHNPCDDVTSITPDKLKFLRKTTNLLIDTMASWAMQVQCGGPDVTSGSAQHVSLSTLWLTLLTSLARLMMK